MLQKYMCMLGIGSAKIDLVLPKYEFTVGENIEGQFNIAGGFISQPLKRIECDLIMHCEKREIDEVIGSSTILTSKIIKPKQTQSITFSYQLPEELPETSVNPQFKFRTRLIFHEGVKSADTDNIVIKTNDPEVYKSPVRIN
ncbi:sporulation protein [Bacillus mesophilum]|nr:sporulation protein [Bacillus mesophilum]